MKKNKTKSTDEITEAVKVQNKSIMKEKKKDKRNKVRQNVEDSQTKKETVPIETNQENEVTKIDSVIEFLKKNESVETKTSKKKEETSSNKNKEDFNNTETEKKELLQNNSQNVKKNKKKEKKEMKKQKHFSKETLEDRKKRTVFVGNVPLSISKKNQLLRILGIDSSLVESIIFRSKPLDEKFANNKRLGCIAKKYTDAKDNHNAYVVLHREEDVSTLLKKNSITYEGYVLRINRATEVKTFDGKRSICIKNLCKTLNEKDLYEMFKEVDVIKGIRILRDTITSRSAGVAFILFENRNSVKKAISDFNGKEIKGRAIVVEKVKKEGEAKNDRDRRRNSRNTKANKKDENSVSNKMINKEKFFKFNKRNKKKKKYIRKKKNSSHNKMLPKLST